MQAGLLYQMARMASPIKDVFDKALANEGLLAIDSPSPHQLALVSQFSFGTGGDKPNHEPNVKTKTRFSSDSWRSYR